MTPLAHLDALLEGRSLTAAYDPTPWAAWLSEHGDQVRELIEAACRGEAPDMVRVPHAGAVGLTEHALAVADLAAAVAPFLREQP